MADHRDVDTEVERALANAASRQPTLPEGFTASVMEDVKTVQGGFSGWRRWRRGRQAANFSRRSGVVSSHSHLVRPTGMNGGDHVGKRILWGVMGLGAAAVIAAFYLDIPPIGDGTSGTIGAAKRFQGATMSEKDVKTGPMAVQQFIQSESFDRILKNATLRNIMIKVSKDPKLQKAFTDAAVIELFTNRAFIEMFTDVEFQKAFEDAAFQRMFEDAAFQRMFEDAAFQRMFEDAAFQRMFEDAAFVEALGEPSFKEMMREPAFVEAMSLRAFADAMKEPAFVDMLGEPAFVKALGEPAFMDAMAEPAFVDAMGEPAFLDALAEPAFIEMMREPAFQEAFRGGLWRGLLGDPEFLRALQGGGGR